MVTTFLGKCLLFLNLTVTKICSEIKIYLVRKITVIVFCILTLFSFFLPATSIKLEGNCMRGQLKQMTMEIIFLSGVHV